ncbi:hypothetical protein ABMA27_009268 [Loxostege sticticalis]|uniref:Kazal-like domain-containing protein n=1 Tax=Loxostege sticticalis TaxID=481309 RepID=A0ABR3HAU5_LOXSC
MKFYTVFSIFLVLAVMVFQTTAEDVILEEEHLEEEPICLYQKPDCICLDHEEPVCSLNGCTYGNDCKRVCADAEFAYEGECHDDDYLDDVE